MTKRIKVLLAKPGLDGHLRGINVLARALMAAGFEVVYLGVDALPNEVANAAIQEAVDIIGLSIHAGGPVTLTNKVKTHLERSGVSDIPIIVGGIISKKEKIKLTEMGVIGVFGPGAPFEEIIQAINRATKGTCSG